MQFLHHSSAVMQNWPKSECVGLENILQNLRMRRISFIRKRVRHIQQNDFYRFHDGCFLKTKGFLPKVYNDLIEVFGSKGV